MADCRHESLKYVGQQTTEDGANRYYACTSCGQVLVVTPANNVIGIPRKQPPLEGS